jgi:hypothetical protein
LGLVVLLESLGTAEPPTSIQYPPKPLLKLLQRLQLHYLLFRRLQLIPLPLNHTS